MAKRLQAMGAANYSRGFELTIHEHALTIPLAWKKPRLIFVNSMSDLFHEDVPFKFIAKVFAIMNQTSQHTYQVLTKRSDRLAKFATSLKWSDNIWMGVSIENSDYTFRINHLRSCGAKVNFLSCEPLLGPLDNLDLRHIQWLIVGGESGPKARAMDPKWVKSIRDQCQFHSVPFFFKQWGGTNKKKNGRRLDGRVWSQMPSLNPLCA